MNSFCHIVYSIGAVGILFMCTGLLLAGYLISRLRPKAWQLLLWDIVIGILFIGILICFAYVKCDSKSIKGLGTLKPNEKYSLNILEPDCDELHYLFFDRFEMITNCNRDCNCKPNRFAPVCSEDGNINFFSACHAGCKTVNETRNEKVQIIISYSFKVCYSAII